MSGDLIVVKQLPVIEDQLRQVKAQVESRVNEVLAMACTEETRQAVKAARAALSKEFGELEKRRKEVKTAIMAPYNAFEAVYKDCAANIYTEADKLLAARIGQVEADLKQQKAEKVAAYFNEYRQSLNIDEAFAPISAANINVTLSASEKSLKAAAKAFLDGVADALSVIDTLDHREEVLVEYRASHNLASAIALVNSRYKAMEQVREARRIAQEKQAEIAAAQEQTETVIEETIAPPVVTPSPEPEQADKIYSTAFRVTHTRSALKALKEFMDNGGYVYEQL